jgi:hypothetical protein
MWGWRLMPSVPGQRSGYLQYLPRLYSKVEPPDSQFLLGAVLKIFEKIMTGIDDEVEIDHLPSPETNADAHTHASISAEIAGLHELLDPWKTPTQFLPWLASWVALEFPELQGAPLSTSNER